MGGRGSKSSRGGILGAGGIGGSLFNVQNQNQGNIANQAPDQSNTPVTPGGVTDLTKMTDDELATLVNASKRVDMPNHLADVHDATQNFVYAAGLNAKPQVLDTASFNQYLADNNIPRSQILSRSVGSASYVVNGTRINLTPNQVTQMTKDSDLNYIGGKYGGKVHGAGTYFDMNGGHNTGYAGGATMIGVLNPATAKIINHGTLDSMVSSWQRSHPKSAKAIGAYSSNTMSIYASVMGYNVIKSGSYHNVIDRAALVLRQDNL